MSFEMEEILLVKLKWFEERGRYRHMGAIFFDPSRGTLYAEHGGTLYEWDLQKNESGPEWWIGE